MMNKCFIALGGNQSVGDRDVYTTLTLAIQKVQRPDITLISQSRFYNTPAFPAGEGPDYLNAAIEVSTNMTPCALLSILHIIEHEMGRERLDRWGSRPIDMDLLAYGDQVLPDSAEFERWQNLPLSQQKTKAPGQLILPHPRLHERSFVLVPLMDIAPDWVHPVLQLSVTELVAKLLPEDIQAIRLVS